MQYPDAAVRRTERLPVPAAREPSHERAPKPELVERTGLTRADIQEAMASYPTLFDRNWQESMKERALNLQQEGEPQRVLSPEEAFRLVNGLRDETRAEVGVQPRVRDHGLNFRF